VIRRPALLLGLMLAGCVAPPTAPSAVLPPLTAALDAHIPPFARWPYQAFSREAAVQIALREWRAFGQPVVYPNIELPEDEEREEGLWQRVGEYWWLGLDPRWREQGWTGVHDENGVVFPASEDGNYAWSAAFISYVMRIAGAGSRFPYTPTHSDYINAARRHSLGLEPGTALSAERTPAGLLRRAADRPLSGPLRHRGRNPVRLSRCDRRQCRQRRRDEAYPGYH